VRNGRHDLIGPALVLALFPQAGQAQSLVPRTEYEELTEAPKPVPSIPASLAGIVHADSADRMVVKSLDGSEIPIDIEWYEPDEFKLFAGERYLGYSYGGYEAYGYILVDRAMSGKAAVIGTGREPVFSPDGRFLAAAESSESGYGNLNGVALWEMLPGASAQRFFTNALPFGWDWQIDSWARPDCVAVSAIVEEWAPQTAEESESGRTTAPRRHYALVIEEAGIKLLNNFDQPGCTDLQAAGFAP